MKTTSDEGMNAAIYARFSGGTLSIEDQILICKRAAKQNGWIIQDEYITSDALGPQHDHRSQDR